MQIVKIYTRHYRDNGQVMAYVEFKDKRSSGGIGRVEGRAEDYHGVTVPCGKHLGALFDRALHDGLTVTHEVW